jgi:ribosomal protein S18 acetylase RimI-like enzyme
LSDMRMSNRDELVVAVAGDSDGAALIEMRRAFFESQISLGLLDLPEDPEAFLEASTLGLLRSSRALVALARHDGRLVGYATSVTRIIPEVRQKSAGLIEEVYVSPAFRGRGVAGQMVEYILEGLRSRDVVRVQIRALASNPTAIALWRRLGFQPHLLLMEFCAPIASTATGAR